MCVLALAICKNQTKAIDAGNGHFKELSSVLFNTVTEMTSTNHTPTHTNMISKFSNKQ